MRFFSSLLSSTIVGSLAAADLASDGTLGAASDSQSSNGSIYNINDLRLMAGFLPDHNMAFGQDVDWDHNYRIAIEAMRTPMPLSDSGGFIYGFDIAFNNGSRSVSGDRTSYVGLLGDGLAGWAYRLNSLPSLHFEGTALIGIGVDRFHDDIGGSPTAFTYEYGLRVAGFWTFQNLWQVGLDLRYVQTKAKPEFGGSVGGTTYTTTGPAILFVVGERF